LLKRDDWTGLAVFVHTGGQAGLRAYQPAFAA
jgi:1-aminocyclopropane-1-carboxylate deaminase/D-cysteine desulfhydrase-like pyridoxal-dependent ACC family enzyme